MNIDTRVSGRLRDQTRAAHVTALLTRWEAVLIYLLIGVAIVFSTQSPYFLDGFNLLNTTLNFTERAIIALPLIFVIIAGDIDISMAGIMALSSLSMGMAAGQGAGVPGLIVIGLVVGLAAGILNGLIITFFDVPSIAVAIGSRAEQGSSIRMTSGCTAMARAIHRRCC